MLSAFTARPLVELKQRDKSKVEAVLTYGDRLLVGLSTGSLRIYRVSEGSIASDKSIELLREQEKFSKYKIEQLAIVKEAGTLISLSNGLVSTHDLSTYDLQDALAKTKGASTFAVTSNIVKDQGIPIIVSRLAVAVKRRLLLWTWQDSDLINEAQEITLVTGIKTLTWATATRLVAGLTSSYVLVDVENSNITDIVGPGSIGGGSASDGGRFGGAGVASLGYMGMGGMVPKPLATKLKDGELMLAKDINTHFIDTQGQSLGRRQIPWAVAPEAIGYSYPFLLSLNSSKGSLEVRNPETLTMLQSIALPNANQLYVRDPSVSLAHAGKGFLVASERCIWRMDALGYDKQIESLIEKRRYEEAISLLGSLEDALLTDKEGRLKETRMLKAQELFELSKYRDSMDLFIKANAPPERVVALYPAAISGESSAQGDSVPTEPVSKTVSGGDYLDTSKNGEQDPVSTLVQKVKKAADTGDASETASLGSTTASEAPHAQRKLEGKDLERATVELYSFLAGSRKRMQRFIAFDGTLKDKGPVVIDENDVYAQDLLLPPLPEDEQELIKRLQETAKAIDTTLFRGYMFARPGMAGSLFRLPNFCDANVVKEKLLESKRYIDIVDFLYGKRLHREALDLLQKLAKDEKEEKLPPLLQGPQRTVAYLQSLPAECLDLILEYDRWPLETNGELGMGVFVAETEAAESFPRNKVLSFLKSIDVRFAVQYLEHIIWEWDEDSPSFHNELVEEYLGILKSSSAEEETEIYDKLLEFLKSSKHYQSWKILPLLQRGDSDVFEARAIVLGKMSEHRQALSIYVFDMESAAKAEEYCNQVYVDSTNSVTTTSIPRRASTSTDDISPSVYNVLLSLYLSPPRPHEPRWGPALDLLAKHGSRLPASSTLDLIPEVLTVKKLESYFTARIRSANTIVNEARIVAGLQRTLDLSEEARLKLGEELPGGHRGRNRNVIITEDRVCGVCHKRFGGSAIKVMPNNAVVHYGCSVK